MVWAIGFVSRGRTANRVIIQYPRRVYARAFPQARGLTIPQTAARHRVGSKVPRVARSVAVAHDLAPFRLPAAALSSLTNPPWATMTELRCLLAVGLAVGQNCNPRGGGGTGCGGCR